MILLEFLLKFHLRLLSKLLPGLLLLSWNVTSGFSPEIFLRDFLDLSWTFSQFFSGISLGISAGAVANVSHEVLPAISFTDFSRFFLVLLHRTCCYDPTEMIFKDFLGVTTKVLPSTLSEIFPSFRMFLLDFF